MNREKLIKAAIDSLDFSYAPYSKFHVGAALLTEDGEIYTGCNIENSSYSGTNCAERTAFFKAVSEGVKGFQEIAIVGGHKKELKEYCAPCGICRQVMREFCNPKNFKIIMARSQKDYIEYTLEELLPLSFGPEALNSK